MSEQLSLIPDTPPACYYAVVDLDQIQPDSELYGDPPAPAFVENIREVGVLQPVGLVDPQDPDGEYKVIYGRKRIKALRQIGRVSVPAMVFASEHHQNLVLTVVENAQRVGNPVTDLEAIDELMRRGATVQDMAEAFGLTVSQVRARVRLLRLIPELRQALRDGKMLSSAATEAARLPEDRQLALAALLDHQDMIRVVDVRQQRRARREGALAALPDALFSDPTEVSVSDVPPAASPVTPPAPHGQASEIALTSLRAALTVIEASDQPVLTSVREHILTAVTALTSAAYTEPVKVLA